MSCNDSVHCARTMNRASVRVQVLGSSVRPPVHPPTHHAAPLRLLLLPGLWEVPVLERTGTEGGVPGQYLRSCQPGCLCLRSVKLTGAGLTWRPRRSSLWSTMWSLRVRAGCGAAAALRTPGMEAARCFWTASSLPLTRLPFVPSEWCVHVLHEEGASAVAASSCLSFFFHFQVLPLTSHAFNVCVISPLFCTMYSPERHLFTKMYYYYFYSRIFSLHVPLASQTLAFLIFKSSPGISASLELRTTDTSVPQLLDSPQIKCES